jgi:hypothetical protein
VSHRRVAFVRRSVSGRRSALLRRRSSACAFGRFPRVRWLTALGFDPRFQLPARNRRPAQRVPNRRERRVPLGIRPIRPIPPGGQRAQPARSRSTDRGRRDRLNSAPPPSEPCRRISRTRLSSQWFYLEED